MRREALFISILESADNGAPNQQRYIDSPNQGHRHPMKLIKILFVIALILASERMAKAQGQPAPNPCLQFFSASGQPLAGGFLYTYSAGTTTPISTFTDATLTMPNTNPIILNAGGFPVNATGGCGIWLQIQTAYKFVLQNSLGVVQWTGDNITTSAFNTLLSQPNTWTSLQTFNGGISTTGFSATVFVTSNFNTACILDGVTNTTLNAAVACLGGRGGKVWVPASTSNYSLASTVTLGPGVDLECMGGPGLSTETNGPCTFSVSPGVTALEASGNHITVQGLHFISQDTGAGTDDCIRIQGDFFRSLANTCEHFGRDGFRIDSAVGGSGFADFFHGEDTYSNANYGDGFHWAPSGVDENAGVCERCDAYNNGGYGFHAEQGSDNILISPTVQNNTTGGYYFANTVAWNLINPYCESGTGSTFTFAASATWMRAAMPFFGQCTTISNLGGNSNQYNYGTTGSTPQWNGLLWGPDAGNAGPIIYQLQSGVQGTGYASMYDVTDNQVVWQYFPSTKIFDFTTQLQGTSNSANYYVALTGNNSGTHQDSGFYQTATVSGCTTGASQGNACASPMTVTWPNAFADTNYKAGCDAVGAPTNYPSAPYNVTLSAGSMTVNYIAITAAAASWPNLDCWAVHN